MSFQIAIKYNGLKKIGNCYPNLQITRFTVFFKMLTNSKIAYTKHFISIFVFVVLTRAAYSRLTFYFTVQSVILIKQFKMYQ